MLRVRRLWSPVHSRARLVPGWLALGGLAFGAALAMIWPPIVVAGTSGFLCPSSGRLISVGAPTEEVRRRCREPDDIQRRVELRTVRETRRVWTNGVAQEVQVERTVEVPIEEWFFDFGPTRFTKTLRFETGRLVYVDEGSKGTVGGG